MKRSLYFAEVVLLLVLVVGCNFEPAFDPGQSDDAVSAADALSRSIPPTTLRELTNNGTMGPMRMAQEGSYLYVADSQASGGAVVYRSSNQGTSWTPISPSGITGDPNRNAVIALYFFEGKLYAGTWESGGAHLFRTANPDASDPGDVAWETITDNGFGNPENVGINNPIEFEGYIYIPCFNPGEGSEVWRSTSGDPDTYTMSIPKSWNRADNSDTTVLYVYDGYLYAGIEVIRATGSARLGTAIYRTAGGDGALTWEKMSPDGFGTGPHDGGYNQNTGSIQVYIGYMYAGTWNPYGLQVWRTAMTGPTWTWEKVVNDGNGSGSNEVCQALVILGDELFYGSAGSLWTFPGTGRFYRTSNGTSWTRISQLGFLSYPMAGVLMLHVFHEKIYISVHRMFGTVPGQIWVYE
jgi:hypothetical protein